MQAIKHFNVYSSFLVCNLLKMKEPIWFKINAAVYGFQYYVYIHKLSAVVINNDIHFNLSFYLFLIKNNVK